MQTHHNGRVDMPVFPFLLQVGVDERLHTRNAIAICIAAYYFHAIPFGHKHSSRGPKNNGV